MKSYKKLVDKMGVIWILLIYYVKRDVTYIHTHVSNTISLVWGLLRVILYLVCEKAI